MFSISMSKSASAKVPKGTQTCLFCWPRRREQQNISLDAVDLLVGDKSLCLTLDLRPLEDMYIEREMMLILKNALQKLPDHHRRLFMDVLLNGKSISSIARTEGVHESTVRERLWRLEKKLRNYVMNTPE